MNTLIQTFTQVVSHHAGCDVYVETTISPPELAAHLQRLCEHTPFTLTMMSNRGTQVWPSGSVFTEVVDYYRVRFELRNPAELGRYGQAAAIALLNRIAEKFAVTDFQPLKIYDGKPGFSLAQGQ